MDKGGLGGTNTDRTLGIWLKTITHVNYEAFLSHPSIIIVAKQL